MGEQVKIISDSIDIKWVNHSEIFTSNTTWKNDSGKIINAMVTCIGGGGYGGFNGGGSGYIARESVNIPHGTTVNITIGNAGDSAGINGGTTSFGTYISANGGGGGTATSAGSGGAGGGGARKFIKTIGYRAMYDSTPGGNGQFGGGGGGCGGQPAYTTRLSDDDTEYAAQWITDGAKGGTGGTYGGGGGGGGGSGGYYWNDYVYVTLRPTNGAAGGASNGNGGKGGKGGNGGDGSSYIPTAASVAENGVNTTSLQEEFKGTGVAGIPGALDTSPISMVYQPGPSTQTTMYFGRGGPGGAGGGGYGGVGGNGSVGYMCLPPSEYNGSATLSGGGAGGGGGGYGGKGGNAANGRMGSDQYVACFGGGGGGWGHAGADATSSSAGGGGGYGPNNYGCGSGGTNTVAKAGICFMTWTTKEIIVS